MVIFTKKFGQFKQWTGEKLGSTAKTQKPTEIKQLQNETKSRFDGISDIRNSLNSYMKSLDESRHSSMGELAQAISSQSHFHGGNEFGTLLVTFGDGLSQLSDHQNGFADEIRSGLLMSLDALLHETKEFERLRKKLKNRRLDYDANNNKLQKSKKEDPALEENVKNTKLKYEETLQKLEGMMVAVSRQETELIDPFIAFMESQINHFHSCLKTSESILQVLKEGKTDIKSIDFVAASFRRELEEDEFWSSSQEDSDEDNSLSVSSNLSRATSKVAAKKEEPSLSIMVKANYNFMAESEKEMSLKKGDLIIVTKKIDEGWWVGTCNGKSGMFPSNYVALLDGEENEEMGQNKAVEKLDVLSLESTDQEEEKIIQSNAKPGFSYLPQGTPITFIGRKKGNDASQSEQVQQQVEMSCGQCDCEEFAANVFKAGHCNNCFHKH